MSSAPGDAAAQQLASPHRELLGLSDLLAPYAIRVAATLGLADRMTEGTTSVDALAAAVAVDPDALRRLLRYLAARGVFQEEADGSFSLNRPARLLRRRAGFKEWLELDGASGRMDLAYTALLDAIRTGAPVYEKVHGRGFWEDIAANPALASSFEALMSAKSAWLAREVAGARDWRAARHVVDVGGGVGTLMIRILRAYPDLRGTLLDLPPTAAKARDAVAKAGLGERCSVVGGSFFETLPEGGDVYLLSDVLHDWNDAHATAILHRCAEAAGGSGRVVIVEGIVGEDTARELSTELDLRMLVLVGGRQRTLPEFEHLLGAAGLKLLSVRRLRAEASMLECAR
jgi:hypothetical protein